MIKKTIKEILAGQIEVGAPVTIEGWIRTRRDSKAGLSFLGVHDGSCFDPIQVVAEASLANYQTEILHLTTHCAVHVNGTLAESQGKGQKFEVKASEVKVIGWVENPDTYPVSAKRHTMEHLRSVAHLRPAPTLLAHRAGARLPIDGGASLFSRAWISMGSHADHHDQRLRGGGRIFRVSTLDLANLPRDPAGHVDFSADFFGKPASLTVSGQLNVESYCLALSRVYTFGPTFRAENSNTTRHLAEFWMIEPEIAFADLADDADLAEDFLKYLFKTVLEERADDMAFFASILIKSVSSGSRHL